MSLSARAHLQLWQRSPATLCIEQNTNAGASDRSPDYKEIMLFPNCANCRNWCELQPSRARAVARKQGNLDFCPCLILSLLLVPCPSIQVRALLERDCLGGPEIKATVLGGTSDSCYNINTGSRHKLVYEVMFFILGRLFCYFPKRGKKVKSGLIWILATKFKHAFKEVWRGRGAGRKLQASNCR